MKFTSLGAGLLALTAVALTGAEVSVGARWEEVQAALGRPNGRMALGARQVWVYDRGTVELNGGRVTRLDLCSVEEQRARAAKAEEAKIEQAQQQARIMAEGTALRDRRLTEASFLNAPAAYQVAYWEDFSRRYPGVPCVEPLTIARLKLAEQEAGRQRKEADEHRLRELETRVAAAEQAPTYHRIAYRPVFRGRYDRQQEFALWPISYTYFDAPRPVYSSPTNAAVNSFSPGSGLPNRWTAEPECRDDGFKPEPRGRSHPRGWPGADWGRSYRRNRG